MSDQTQWRKHEDLWALLSKSEAISPEFDKYILPPNDDDVLISMYCNVNKTFLDKIVFDNNTTNPRQEIIKWKDSYKRCILRWHPDKLISFLDRAKIKEDRKSLLKRKSGVILNNINKSIMSIVEFLKHLSK